MLTSISFDSFRCFSHLELSGLKKLNIVVGSNGFGKTTFLEGLFMLAGASGDLYFRTRVWRGLGERVRLKFTKEDYSALFSSLFARHDQKKTVYLQMTDSTYGQRSLSISYSREQVSSLPLSSLDKEQEPTSLTIRPITFQWQLFSGETFSSTIQVEGDNVRFSSSEEVFPIIFLSPMTVNIPRETGKRFSDVSKKGQLQQVVEAVATIYPEIDDLSLEYEADTPIIHASTKFLSEKIPLQLFSAGVTKYISLVLSIVSNKNGVVLIDEIENGFYFEKFEGIWRSISQLCDMYNVQIFATTHSWEFLKALEPCLKEDVDQYCLLRSDKSQGDVRLQQFSGNSMLGAIRQGMELR